MFLLRSLFKSSPPEDSPGSHLPETLDEKWHSASEGGAPRVQAAAGTVATTRYEPRSSSLKPTVSAAQAIEVALQAQEEDWLPLPERKNLRLVCKKMKTAVDNTRPFTHVVIDEDKEVCEMLDDCKSFLSQIETLSLMPDDDLRNGEARFVSRADWKSLKSLEIACQSGSAAILAQQMLPKLQKLNSLVVYSPAGNDIEEVLAALAGPNLRTLKVLELFIGGDAIDDESDVIDRAFIKAMDNLSALEKLSINSEVLNVEDLFNIDDCQQVLERDVTTTCLPALCELYFTIHRPYYQLDDETKFPLWPALKHLRVMGIQTEDTLLCITNSAWFKQLKTFDCRFVAPVFCIPMESLKLGTALEELNIFISARASYYVPDFKGLTLPKLKSLSIKTLDINSDIHINSISIDHGSFPNLEFFYYGDVNYEIDRSHLFHVGMLDCPKKVQLVADWDDEDINKIGEHWMPELEELELGGVLVEEDVSSLFTNLELIDETTDAPVCPTLRKLTLEVSSEFFSEEASEFAAKLAGLSRHFPMLTELSFKDLSICEDSDKDVLAAYLYHVFESVMQAAKDEKLPSFKVLKCEWLNMEWAVRCDELNEWPDGRVIEVISSDDEL